MSKSGAAESKVAIGEGVEPETLRLRRLLVEADPGVAHVSRLLTMYFGPHEVLLTLEVKFRDELSAVGVRATVAQIQRACEKNFGYYPNLFCLGVSRRRGV